MGIQDLLTRTCTILRPVEVTSSLGEQSFTFTTVSTNVPCEIQERTVERGRKDVGEFSEGRVRGYFLPDQDIQEKDKVVDDEGLDYEVKFVDDLRSLIRAGVKHHKEVILTKPHKLDEGGPFG